MLRPSVYTCVASVSLLLFGCSTTVRGTKKMDDYEQKISSSTIMWQSNPNLRFQIRKTAGLPSLAAITEPNRQETIENLGKLLQMLTTKSAGAVSGKLRAKGLFVSELDNDAPTSPKGYQHLIKVYPDFAGSECSAVNCSHDIGLIVTVWDFGLKKTVWQGDFKVGAPMGGAVTDKLLENFSSSVVDELQRAKLIE